MTHSKGILTAAFLSTFLIFHLLTATSAFSWFDKGHRIVGLIAQANLSTEARKEVAKILPGFMTLGDAAIWPDHEGRSVRDFDPLHYVSIAENADSYDQARDCPQRNCMVEALKWFLSVATDKNAPLMMRRLGLYYVVHLTGDLHQPLHAGRAADQGGTDIPVSYKGTKTNLHFFWDTDLVEMEIGNAEEVAKRLNVNITEEERFKWRTGDFTQWTNESLVLARSLAYNTGASLELPDDYVERARPIVRTRLAQAGVRLARLLNGALK
jgi:nuclease S1